MTTYGYVGLGEMGSAIVDRLVDCDESVVVYDLDQERTDAAAGKGAVAAASAAEVAELVDVVGICVPADRHVEAVISGPGGLAKTAKAGQVVLVHSTVLPSTVRNARDTVEAWGGVLHDACVAGGVDAARRGEMVLLVGALTDVPEAAARLLHLLGDRLLDAGPVGAGAALKVGVNVMSYAQFSAAAAAFDLVERNGADSETLLEAWRHIGQLGRLTESYVSLLALPDEVVAGSMRAYLAATAEIARKDLDLAAELAHSGSGLHSVINALGEAVPEVFRVRESSSEDDRGGQGG